MLSSAHTVGYGIRVGGELLCLLTKGICLSAAVVIAAGTAVQIAGNLAWIELFLA
jgi:hypothetical protein